MLVEKEWDKTTDSFLSETPHRMKREQTSLNKVQLFHTSSKQSNSMSYGNVVS